MIKLNNINKYYNKGKSNEIHVINNTNIELPDTGLVVFLGKSGSGKSTLLNVIGGLDKANGEISYDDMKLVNYKPSKIDNYRNEHIGYVFQNYNNLNENTIYENLKIALNIYAKLSLKEIDKRINYCLNAVGLYKYRNKLCKELSGGQQQRVSIARALVKNSKIIIADEPTGNLDSQNSIEVMNILAKVSETRLVLLVTHNEELASFYASRIIRIVDGKIISDLSNDSKTSSIDIKDNSNIYLKDLAKKSINESNLNIDLYNKENEEFNLDLKIVKSGGKYYLKSTMPLEIINSESSVKLIDSHYESITKENVTNYSFNTDDFVMDLDKSFSLKKFIKKLFNSISSFFRTRKRTKLGYYLFGCIGAITALAMVFLSSSNYYDLSSYDIFDGYVLDNVTNDNVSSVNDNLHILLNSGYVDNYINSSASYSLTLLTNNTVVPKITIGRAMVDYYNNNSVSYGSSPSLNKICITSKTYKYIKDNYYNIIGVNKEDIIGLKVSLGIMHNYETYEICGIINDDNSNTVYFFEEEYFEMLRQSNKNNIGVSLNFATPNKELLDTISGSFDENSSDPCIIIPSIYRNSNKLGSKMVSSLSKITYYVTGYYNDVNSTYLSYVSSAHLIEEYKAIINSFIKTYSYSPNINLSEGCLPTNNEEYLVSIYDDKAVIGENGVTGKFIPDEYLDNFIYYTTKSKALASSYITLNGTYLSYLENIYNNTYALKISNENLSSAKALLTNGMTLVNSHDFYYSKLVKSNDVSVFMLPIAFVCLAIVSIYSFFMIRSKMMFDIKNIGILRAIGMKKKELYLHYLLDTLVLTTFTSVIGYGLFVIVFNYLLNSFTMLQTFLNLSAMYLTFGLLLLYIISIIFGLLPVYLLLRKSPQDIINKYDL